MKQKTLALLLKIAIICVALCAALVYCWIVPDICGKPLAEAGDGEFAYMYVPWLVVISITALPVLASLVLAWMVSVNIGKDRSFCMENAKHLAAIAILIGADVAYFFIANVVLLFCSMNHPGLFLLSVLVCVVGTAIAVAAAVLSHFIRKAAELQEQSDLTI